MGGWEEDEGRRRRRYVLDLVAVGVPVGVEHGPEVFLPELVLPVEWVGGWVGG